MPTRPMILRKNSKDFFNQNVPKRVATSPAKNSINKKCKVDGAEELMQLLLHTTQELGNRQRHHHFPALNVCAAPLQSIDELQVFPTCIVSTPQPVYVANQHCAYEDICERRTLTREWYRKRLLTARTRFQTAHESNRKMRAMEKRHVYHMSIFDLAERLKLNPDPFFNSSYDYYFTGGNLCVLPERYHNDYVCHVNGENLQNLIAAELKSTQNDACSLILEPMCTSSLPAETSEIFEVQSLRSPFSKYSNCLAVRQQTCITLYTLQPKKRLKLLTQFKTNNGTPLISFAQSATEDNLLLISSMRQHVRCYDLNTGNSKLTKLYNLNEHPTEEVISWTRLQPGHHRQTFFYANEKKLCYMDLRTTPKEWLKSSCGFSAQEFVCEVISSLSSSEFDNLFYVGTSHKMHCLDIRQMPQNFEAKGTICRWTHQLEYAPTFVETYRQDNVEYVALASALSGDMRICELTQQGKASTKSASESLYKSVCLPYQPPTLQEAYESARLAGKCLQPGADLTKRIRCCTTGLTIARPNSSSSNSTASLLWSNSNGDVFAQCISQRKEPEREVEYERTTHESNEVMAHYAEQICRNTQFTLNHTDVADLKFLNKIFRCHSLNAPLKAENRTMENTASTMALPNRRFLGRWQKSMQTLHSYKDALAQDLLAIWDIDYKEEKNIQLNGPLRIKPDPETIVTDWLNSSPATNQPHNTVLTSNIGNSSFGSNESTQLVLTETLTQEFESLPQSTQVLDESISRLEASAFDLQQTQNSTANTTQNKSKIAKKKSKYIKGF